MGNSRKELIKIQHRIYAMVNKYFGGVFTDSGWQNVKRLIDAISNVEGVDDIDWKAGEYFHYLTYANNNQAPYRDYETMVFTQYCNKYLSN